MQLFFANFFGKPKNQGEIEEHERNFPTKSMEKTFSPVRRRFAAAKIDASHFDEVCREAAMTDILEKILAVKAAEVEKAKKERPMKALMAAAAAAPAPAGFARALQAKMRAGLPAVIAEVKKASPSKGVICECFEPAKTAQDYARNGAACLSVLTDRNFFMGSNEVFAAVREAVSIPLLRKDFLIDPYQVYEARAMGADAVLVIMRALDDDAALELTTCAQSLGMDVLVETHDAEEIERALKLPGCPILGINNRNLRTFETSIEQTLRFKDLVPQERLFVTESGIRTEEDVLRLRQNGVNAFLVGEAFMRESSPGAAMRRLFGALQ